MSLGPRKTTQYSLMSSLHRASVVTTSAPRLTRSATALAQSGLNGKGMFDATQNRGSISMKLAPVADDVDRLDATALGHL